MSYFENVTTCRLCGLSCEQSINIFGRVDDVNMLQYKIKQLLDIAVGPSDNLPHSLCLLCVSKLDSLWCFKNTCHQVQMKLRKMNRSMMFIDRLQSDFDKRPSNLVTLGLRTHKNDSSTCWSIHDEKGLYPLSSSTSKSYSSTELLGDNFNECSDDVNLSKKKSTSSNIDSSPVSLAVELENNENNQFTEETMLSDSRLDLGNKSVSNNIESTLIHTHDVKNCISDYEDTNDYNCNIEDDNSMSVASEGTDNVECDTDISRPSDDLTLQASSTLKNESTFVCEVVDNSEMNSSSITNGTGGNINFKTEEKNDRNSTEISLLSATTSSEIAKSFEGHCYTMEADINSDLLCNRVPYLIVESRMGTKHMIYTVSSNLSKFDIEHNYMLNTDSVYLTVVTFDLENPKTVSMLIEWMNNVLKGEMSLLPYYISWLDEKNQLNLGFKCIICKKIMDINRQLVMNHIADHLLFICPVCDKFHRNISNMKKHLYQHETVTFECSTCDEKFSDFEKYIIHKRGHYKFECLSCQFECFDEENWLKHLEEHREKNCSSDCCLFYESINKFREHVSELSTVGGYVCGECGMPYHCEEYLKLHLRIHGLEHASKTTSLASLPESAGSQNEVTKKIIDCLKNSNEDIHFNMLKSILDNEIDLKVFQTSSTAPGGRVFTGFMCFKCSGILTTEKKFRIHIENHFMMTCHCKKYVKGIGRLRNHFNLCMFKRRMCVHCRNYVWLDTATEYLDHLSLHQKRRICIYCQLILPTTKNLEHHIRSSHKTEVAKQWFCEYCNETLVVSKSLESYKFYHFKEKHPDKLELFVCEICGKNFDRSSSLLGHTKRKHLGEEKKYNYTFICAYCSKEFFSKVALKSHIQRHMNEKTFKCTICDKAFNRESSLFKHNLDMHSVKKHMCNVCEKRFSYPSALRDHMKKAHAYVKLEMV